MKISIALQKLMPYVYHATVGIGVVVSFLMVIVSMQNAQFSAWGCCGYVVFVLLSVMASSMFAVRYRVYREHEVCFLMALTFCVTCLTICFLAGAGRVCAGGIDAYKAQMSLESGKLCSFHPPRYAYWYNWNVLLSGLGLVFGRNVFVGQLLNALGLSFALIPIYKISRMIFGRGCARFAAIAFGLNPVVVLYSTVLSSECWAATFMVWAYYLIILCFRGKVPAQRLLISGCLIFAGVALGISEFFKPTSVMLKVAVAVAIVQDGMITRNVRRATLRLVLLVCICCISSFVAVTGHKCTLCLAAGKPELRNNTVWSGLVGELVLGLNVKNDGGYDRALAWKMHGGGPEVRIKLLKDSIVRDWREYPALMVRKFINLHGTSWSRGAALSEIRESFRGVTEDQRKKSAQMPLFLVELADNSLVVFRIMFFFAVAGCLFARKDDRWGAWKILPLVVVMEFMLLEQLIECHGRYKSVIYPFFFLVLPGVKGWMMPYSGIKATLINRYNRIVRS